MHYHLYGQNVSLCLACLYFASITFFMLTLVSFLRERVRGERVLGGCERGRERGGKRERGERERERETLYLFLIPLLLSLPFSHTLFPSLTHPLRGVLDQCRVAEGVQHVADRTSSNGSMWLPPNVTGFSISNCQKQPRLTVVLFLCLAAVSLRSLCRDQPQRGSL